MTIQEVTLVAALIAAAVSIATLVVNVATQRSAELRRAHRDTLENFIHDLGESLHSTVATSNILLKAQTDPAILNWRARADAAQAKLKELRMKLRYPLWGLDKGLNTISRLHNWVEHARAYPTYSENILRRGKSLGRTLDSTIRKCYMRGRSPRIDERLRVFYKRMRLEKAYHDFQSRDRSSQS